MKIALAVTTQYPMQGVPGVIWAPIPIHMQIARGLSDLGHDVTVFCGEDSIIEAPLKKYSLHLDSVYKKRKEDPDGNYTGKYPIVSDNLLFSKMYELANEGQFDVILNSDPLTTIQYARFSKVPTVFTIHDPLNMLPYELLKYYREYSNCHFVSISDAQRAFRLDINFETTIYNGINVENIPFSDKPEDYFVFFGRILKMKGVLADIMVAKNAGVKLKIIGPFYENTDAQKEYIQEIKSHIDGENIEYLGSMDQKDLLPIVSKARGFINLVDVHESFGMVLIESLATGTPIIATKRGAIPEIIEDGKTGYLVNNIDQAVECIGKIDMIDRNYCRKYVEDNFSMRNCINKYDALLKKII